MIRVELRLADPPGWLLGKLPVPKMDNLAPGFRLTWLGDCVPVVLGTPRPEVVLRWYGPWTFKAALHRALMLPGFFADPLALAHLHRITPCKSCGAPMVWFSATRSRIPIDAETVAPDDDRYRRGVHRPHFVTCPDADQHRKGR